MKLVRFLSLALTLTALAHGQNDVNFNPKEAKEQMRKGLAGEKKLTPKMVLTLEAIARNEEPPKDETKFSGLAALSQEEMRARIEKAIDALTDDQLLKMMHGVRQRATAAKSLTDAKQIAIAVLMYDADHGKFPAELKDLVNGKDKYLESEEALSRMTTISLPDGRATLEYVPNLSTQHSQAILLHSSKAIGGKWLVAHVDGSVMMVSEEKYAEEMKATAEMVKKAQAK